MEMTSPRKSMDIGALKKIKSQNFYIDAPLSKNLNYESQNFIPNLHINSLSY